MRVKGLLHRDCRFFLEFFERVERGLDLPPREWLELMDELEEKVDQLAILADPLQVKIISSMLLPGTVKFLAWEVQFQALLRVTYSALGLELERKGWPAEHEFEEPARAKLLSVDPYSGEPLVTRKSPDGILVYSIGRNRADDSGQSSRKNTRPGNDISFRVNWKEPEF
jgi:hypothetical protein